MASTQEREGTARFLGSYKWNETEKRVSAVKVCYDVSVGVRFKVVYEWELMAIVLTVKNGNHIYWRWIAKLLGYNFVIEYKKGLENKATDALSRLPLAFELSLLSVMDGLNFSFFIDQVTENESLNIIRLSLINGQPALEGYSLQGEILCYHVCLVLPKDSPTIPLLLAKFHNNPIGGHHGALKTYQRLAREVYWRGMKAHIYTYVVECSVCQQVKYLL
ncbi:putative retroelement pol polyprotein [Cucumis melo var. makuwa]|uniref:Retroelement pol polyprotein n=1 Tax=Cucumis melo var. makuwa TaxID=1194695 RepID=A0A5A7TCE5_CUCMM|nr:putative retroelement pol polyprotein [Cucumis melo var. makuwa]TYJ99730.1 putative retroelement pol polyprotein [Cucumis melo var. makuwa]